MCYLLVLSSHPKLLIVQTSDPTPNEPKANGNSNTTERKTGENDEEKPAESAEKATNKGEKGETEGGEDSATAEGKEAKKSTEKTSQTTKVRLLLWLDSPKER
jgi:hypothetical protein